MIAHVGDREILTVVGTLGHRPSPLAGQWATRPDVPPPADCPPRPLMNRHEGTIMDRLESKLADARPYWELTGRRRFRQRVAVGAAPRADRRVGGRARDHRRLRAVRHRAGARPRAGGNSLDNTLRVAHRVPTEWVLADVRVHAVADGFGHGLVHLWAENGTLLGTASQSTIVRAHGPVEDGPDEPAR